MCPCSIIQKNASYFCRDNYNMLLTLQFEPLSPQTPKQGCPATQKTQPTRSDSKPHGRIQYPFGLGGKFATLKNRVFSLSLGLKILDPKDPIRSKYLSKWNETHSTPFKFKSTISNSRFLGFIVFLLSQPSQSQILVSQASQYFFLVNHLKFSFLRLHSISSSSTISNSRFSGFIVFLLQFVGPIYHRRSRNVSSSPASSQPSQILVSQASQYFFFSSQA